MSRRPAPPSRRRVALAPCPALAVLLLSGTVAAQATWIALDPGAAPDSPALLELMPTSSQKQSRLRLTIRGFWSEDVQAPDGTLYQRLDFPGLGTPGPVGTPGIPARRLLLALPAGATDVELVGHAATDPHVFPNVRLYPVPSPAVDEDPSDDPGPGDTTGKVEGFVLDPNVYAMAEPWPTLAVELGKTETDVFGPVDATLATIAPATWNPASEQLVVHGVVTVLFEHLAPTPTSVPMSKPKAQLAPHAFANWDAIATSYPAELVEYRPRLLILGDTPDAHLFDAFVAHKQALGFEVTWRQQFMSIAQDRQTIADWYAEAPSPAADHFCLLVGDTNRVELGTVIKSDEAVPTDDLYGAVGHDGIFKQVHVGRLSVDDDDDLVRQLAKIMAYETDPIAGGDYDEALLVAHIEDAPGKYEGVCETVRQASYAHAPTFLTRYGSVTPTDLFVQQDIEQGVGLVAYRGHGSTNQWAAWNLAHDGFTKSDVVGLRNPLHPVVWSIACTNANLDYDDASSKDCLAETWLETDAGAVACYAATLETFTEVNHEHFERLFEVLYDTSHRAHGVVLDLAELLLWADTGDTKNPWAYLLLGDPSMRVRIAPPGQLLTSLPTTVSAGVPGQVLTLSVTDAQGAPLADGLVSAHKLPFLPGGADEILTGLWLDELGQVQLDLSDLSPGVVEIVTQAGDGSVLVEELEVGMGPQWTDLGHGLAGTGGLVPRLVGTGDLQGGSAVSILLKDARPSTTAWFLLGLSVLEAPFKGGVLVPDPSPPSLGLPLPTDPNGSLGFAMTWPAGLPGGAAFAIQYWIVDPEGPAGFAASNGLLGVTP